MKPSMNIIDRAIGYLSPRAGLQRARARVAAQLLLRHYEGAATGRRTQNWNRSAGDANAAAGTSLGSLRNAARDLIRNNPYAESAVSTIADHAVSYGITAKFRANAAAIEAWTLWSNSTACDVEGVQNLTGLGKQVMGSNVSDGEILVRRIWRTPDSGLPLPFQLQLLEADFLDTNKTLNLADGGRIIQGVEYDKQGRRVAYWLFPQHPGASLLSNSSVLLPGSQRVAAADVKHVFRRKRPGQARGVTWFAPVLLRFKGIDEYEDGELMKQTIASCLAVITSDIDGSATALGTANDTDTTPGVDTIEPGMILNVPPGRNIEVVQPPKVDGYEDFMRVNLRAIATGLGVAYEDLTGDYTGMPYSAARMSRLRHWARVDDWRWRILIPQFYDPVFQWAMEAAQLAGLLNRKPSPAMWSAPPPPMIDPDKEGLGVQRNIRAGVLTLSEAIRERGYDPEELLGEMADDNALLDELGIVLDSDARKMTQAGQAQGSQLPKDPTPALAPASDEEDEEAKS